MFLKSSQFISQIHSVRCSIKKQHSKQLTITSQGTAHRSARSVQGRSQDSTQLPPPERPPGFRLHAASVPLPAHSAAQLTACCSLRAAHCVLLTACCSLHTVHCALLPARCSLRAAHCVLLCSSRTLLAWGVNAAIAPSELYGSEKMELAILGSIEQLP